MHSRIAPTKVKQWSGLKNDKSLNAYATKSTEQQQQSPHIISISLNTRSESVCKKNCSLTTDIALATCLQDDEANEHFFKVALPVIFEINTPNVAIDPFEKYVIVINSVITGIPKRMKSQEVKMCIHCAQELVQ